MTGRVRRWVAWLLEEAAATHRARSRSSRVVGRTLAFLGLARLVDAVASRLRGDEEADG